VKPWVGVWNATIPGSNCIGLDHMSFKLVGQEDCLYLNVYTPKVSTARLKCFTAIRNDTVRYIRFISALTFSDSNAGTVIGRGPLNYCPSKNYLKTKFQIFKTVFEINLELVKYLLCFSLYLFYICFNRFEFISFSCFHIYILTFT